MPLTPATQVTEATGSQVQDQAGLLSRTVSQNKNKKG